jgi:hypothetical protein
MEMGLRRRTIETALLTLALVISGNGTSFGAKPDDAPERSVGNLAAPAPDAAAAEAKGSELFSKLVERNDDRTRRLKRYTGTREYELRNDKDQLSAREVVRVQFRAPDTKNFETVSEEGSKWIRKFVFHGLISSESEATAGREHRDSSITPLNYSFRYLGEQELDGARCFVVYATPKRADKYLFEGTVWIDARDFAVAKIDGHPAKNPSFWIKRVNWVRRYGRVGDFWLPMQDETYTEIKIFGKKKLTIRYQDYVVNAPATGRGTDLKNAAGGNVAGAD